MPTSSRLLRRREHRCSPAAVTLVFLGSTEPDGQGMPTPARQSVAKQQAWGVESVSENCASGIGAAAGRKATTCGNGDGGESGVGRGTVSAPGGRTGTARSGAGEQESDRADCVSVGRVNQRRCAARGAGHAGLRRRGSWRASGWRNVARAAGRVKGALPARWPDRRRVAGAAAAVEKLPLLPGWCHVHFELLRAPRT